jgi:hypothetical protein
MVYCINEIKQSLDKSIILSTKLTLNFRKKDRLDKGMVLDGMERGSAIVCNISKSTSIVTVLQGFGWWMFVKVRLKFVFWGCLLLGGFMGWVYFFVYKITSSWLSTIGCNRC